MAGIDAEDGFSERLRLAKGKRSARSFAADCRVSAGAMNQYLSGKSEPTRPVLNAIAFESGVSLVWLLTGEGSMLTTDSPAQTPKTIGYPLPVSTEGSCGVADQPDFIAIDPDLLERLARIAARLFKEAGIKLPPENLTAEAAILFNDLAARVRDLSDHEEIKAAMPWLEYNLKKRLRQAVAKPGLGKRGA